MKTRTYIRPQLRVPAFSALLLFVVTLVLSGSWKQWVCQLQLFQSGLKCLLITSGHCMCNRSFSFLSAIMHVHTHTQAQIAEYTRTTQSFGKWQGLYLVVCFPLSLSQILRGIGEAFEVSWETFLSQLPPPNTQTNTHMNTHMHTLLKAVMGLSARSSSQRLLPGVASDGPVNITLIPWMGFGLWCDFFLTCSTIAHTHAHTYRCTHSYYCVASQSKRTVILNLTSLAYMIFRLIFLFILYLVESFKSHFCVEIHIPFPAAVPLNFYLSTVLN